VIQIKGGEALACETLGWRVEKEIVMSGVRRLSSIGLARGVDRLYGELLILLAVISVAAPLFVEATLAWTLFLAGLAGLWWIALDRTTRGLAAAAGWTLITLGLGFHLAFHAFLGVLPLGLTLGLGFVLLGIAELSLGAERYSRRPAARIALIAGGAIAVVFGLAVPVVWPDLPSWAGGATVATMFATFGAGLLIGAGRGSPGQRGSDEGENGVAD
jgi:hypothetical protein